MIYRVVGLETPILAGGQSASFEFVFPQRGIVRSFWLNCLSGDVVDRAGLGFAFFRRSREMILNDQGRAFISALEAGGAISYAGDWCELALSVESQESWILNLANDGPNTVTPRLLFEVTV